MIHRKHEIYPTTRREFDRASALAGAAALTLLAQTPAAKPIGSDAFKRALLKDEALLVDTRGSGSSNAWRGTAN